MTAINLAAIRARDDACDVQYAHISARDRRALLECVESLAAAARAVSAASDALIVMGDGRAYFDSGAATHEFRAARAALRAWAARLPDDVAYVLHMDETCNECGTARKLHNAFLHPFKPC